MLNIKSMIGASLFAVGAMVALSAFASSYTLAPSTNTISGPTSLTYAGTVIPCTGIFTITITATGTASVTAATFGTNALCTSIKAQGLPWPIAPPTLVSAGVYAGAVTGVRLFIEALGVTCSQLSTDNVTITLNTNASPHTATFSGTLHSGTVPSPSMVACPVNGGPFYTTIGVVYP